MIRYLKATDSSQSYIVKSRRKMQAVFTLKKGFQMAQLLVVIHSNMVVTY